jgi:site-specific recombinase XerD
MQDGNFLRKARATTVRCERFQWRDKKQGRRKAYQHEGWIVDWRDTDGKRHRRKFEEEKGAKLFASEKGIELINGARSVRHAETKLSFEQLAEAEACVTRLGTRYSLSQCVDFFLQHFHSPEFQISVGQASVRFRGALEGQVRDRTLVQLKSTLDQFERFLSHRASGETFLHEVTAADVEGFLRSIRAKDGVNPASRKTWNNYRGDLHQFFEWCADKQRRWLSANPAADVIRFKIDREHIEVLPLKRVQELMKHVAGFKEGKLVRYFALALFAGVRPGGELEKLAENPQLVDLSNRVIRITPAISKTGKPRQIPIRPNLLKWLKRFPGEILPANADRELKAIRKRFELSHDVCRHTFISMHVGAFNSFADAAIESGNSEKIIRDHYHNTSAKPDAKAFWRIYPSKGKVA